MKNVVNRILLTKEIKCEIIFQSFLKTDMQRFSSEETGPGSFLRGRTWTQIRFFGGLNPGPVSCDLPFVGCRGLWTSSDAPRLCT